MESLFEEIRGHSSAGITKRAIIKHCLFYGDAQIPTMSEKLGYSIPTITKYIAELCHDNVMIEQGKVESLKGRKPCQYGINPDACYCIGVDINQFAIIMGLMNFTGGMVIQTTIDDFVFANTPEVLDSICAHVAAFMRQVPVPDEKVLDININISGRVDSKEGYSHSIFNFEESDSPLATQISEKLGKPVYIENDTRAMTYGEYMTDFHLRYQDLLYVNASWGIGLGIVIDGRIFGGKNGYAGEFGHMNVYNNERMCHCGKKGCLETEVSGRALHRKLLERIRNGESSMLSQRVKRGEEITTDDIIQAVADEDMLCIDLVEQLGMELGRQLANMINIFNPQAVIIGGTLARVGDVLIPPVRQAIQKYALKLISRDMDVLTSRLLDDAGVVGSCMIARHKLFES